jgi:outer membrane lipoprotein-sorting protein
MQRSAIASLIFVGIALSTLARPKPASDQDAVMERVDRAGAAFRGMSAKVRRLSHTAVINEDTIDSGMIVLKRARPRDVRMLIQLTDPDPRTVAFQGHKLEIYYPKAATVQEIDMGTGKDRELLEQFLLLGFGTSRADLQASYNVRLVGPDTVGGQKTQLLELIPKSKEVLQHLLKFEMWVAENGYPIQQKFYVPGGDYLVATYSDMKVNPDLPDSSLKLNLPKNVKREYPQK